MSPTGVNVPSKIMSKNQPLPTGRWRTSWPTQVNNNGGDRQTVTPKSDVARTGHQALPQRWGFGGKIKRQSNSLDEISTAWMACQWGEITMRKKKAESIVPNACSRMQENRLWALGLAGKFKPRNLRNTQKSQGQKGVCHFRYRAPRRSCRRSLAGTPGYWMGRLKLAYKL